MIQTARGQGKAEVQLNRTGSSEYRCLQMPTAGENVTCEVLSFHLNNLNGFQLYGGRYEQAILRIAGALILVGGVLDVVSTVLIVGLTAWAYPWIGIEVIIIVTKVIFCLEPIREIEIARVAVDTDGLDQQRGPDPLPLKIQLGGGFICQKVTTDYNIVREPNTCRDWRSTTAGLWVGQVYTISDGSSADSTRYLAIDQQKKLTLLSGEPEKQDNQALQREFLAALATVVEANVVPSRKFIAAVERTLDNIKDTMATNWYVFGSKDVMEKIGKARRAGTWRHCL
ncbi:hypothetical protein LTR10_011545 [Elasticomyces elasticus]|uniref:Uncharacterized protein n=1 Tax=Exophiala sideris TaxID=1016849 RepID=A0ABR0JD30_9EURO|nr:hypothetical protein LTR10_011545 [Elasticomyces elasticus]KAK5031997.1 hypothetical protein LTS07_004619 [Exophiala sideris]KAK5040926.1 hypothetical protein LTR13_003228 [Exophiala sideris]KAK5061740.1 hypothetical protein LTR69_004922 [Exophiala sideris]KAK5184440.1 hypothetical protein LTR44_003113 [Eurotiomycetes sp. CCFEE 6388]